MENHGKYSRMIYAHSPGRLYVNLFLPSTLNWPAQGLALRQETTFPQEPKTRLLLTLQKPQKMTLSLRCPAWVAPGAFTVRVNGQAVPITAKPGFFADVSRLWKSGDRVDIGLPMRLTTEPLPGDAGYAAFFYGPVLLAGQLGTEGLTDADFHGGGAFNSPGQLAQKSIPLSHVPVLVGTTAQTLHKIVPIPGHPLTFQTQGLARRADGKPGDVTLVPFYQLFFERYALYWHVVSPEAYANQQKDAQDLEARTTDRVRVGETDSETAHHLAADNSRTGGAGEPFTHWRDSTAGFSYDLKVLPDKPVSLRCAYWGSDSGRTFDIQVDGKVIATETLTGKQPGEYLYVTYPIPAELTQGKNQVTIHFAAQPGKIAGGLFDLRVLRAP